MKQIHKDYKRPFLLEKTKLDRLMGVIHERLGEHSNTTMHDDFEVFLTGQRREEMISVDDVLNLDNSRKSKIQRLLITCCASTEWAKRPEHEVQVDFDGRTDDKDKAKVIVSVRSEDAGWSDRVLSEVEEQIERTSLQDLPHRVALGWLIALLSIVLFFMVLSAINSKRSATEAAGGMWLRGSDIARVEQILEEKRTISDEEMREIVTRQLRNVFEDQRPAEGRFSGWTRQKTFVAGPLLVVLICAIYLLSRCYPEAVFLWSDEIERYNKMLQTRRIVWTLIIGGIIIGVLSNVLFTGLISWT
ncbi:MAG: hypothetical protein AB7T38_04130 [Nitrospirales bacterium]